MVTVYLWPNAPLTSRRYRENCEIINAAAQLVRSVSGPTILAGDFNTSLTAFDDMKALLMEGWVDAALVDAERRGTTRQPTCQRATRHTFCVIKLLLVPLLRDSQVCFHEDVATHAVLVTEFDLPQNNFRVYKWILPKALDGVAIDSAKLQTKAEQVGHDRWKVAVDDAMAVGKVDEAFANWSELAETVLLSSVVEDGLDVSKPAWSGRGKMKEPVLRVWAPPRFHTGRPGDFRLETPSVALQARRWQKLVRQIESLLRKLRAGSRNGHPLRFEEEIQCIWLAIVGSPVRPRFPRWAFDVLGFALNHMPGPEILEALYTAAAGHAQEISRQCWKAKRETFVSQVQESWNKGGGSFPFRMLREQAHPPVMEMRVRTPVRLAPQRWLPDGKQWIQVQNASDFKVGDHLDGSVKCIVVEVQGASTQLDSRISRKEAADLERTEISLDPEVWSRSFFQGWSAYWQRECEGWEDLPWRQLLLSIPPVDAQPLEAIGFQEWKAALSKAKAASMRGTCGWSVTELKRLPECVIQPLLRLFNQVEQGVPWPKQLQQWLVVLLRKEDGIPEWNSVRPISVASVVYRVWSRIRTKQLLAFCQLSSLPTVGPRLSTRSLWGYVADFVAEEMHAGKAPSGLVLDIVKAFNVLCRPMVADVMKHCGIDGVLVDAWLRALGGMERYVLFVGTVFRANPSLRVSSTGVPEGDPMSVVAMYCMCRFFALWIQAKANVMPLTYADNWQVLASHTRPVLEALPHVADFLTCCALPISPLAVECDLSYQVSGHSAYMVQKLVRLMRRDFPQGRDRMRRGLISLRGGTGGVSYLLAKQLRSFGWLTACETVVHIDPELSRTWIKFPLAEQSLLLTQVTGVTYTRDCLSHAVGLDVSRACPLCGSDDSRLHRVKFCEAVQHLRKPFLAFLNGRILPDHTWAFGLWDEPSELRSWQASLCAVEWPPDFVSIGEDRMFVFSDGSCLSPRNPRLSLAGGAVILAHRTGGYELVWSGIVPGLEQSCYRAELLAITVALASFPRVTVFCDNQEVVKVAARLLKLPPGQREGAPEPGHIAGGGAHFGGVQWLCGRRSKKKVVVSAARLEGYRGLFAEVQAGKELATKLADLQVAIAQAFVEVDQAPVLPLEPAGFAVCGRGAVGFEYLDAGSQVHAGFGESLVRWLGALRRFDTCAAGWTYTSAVELLWQFIFDTGQLPPFWFEGQWHTLSDSVLNSFVVPRMSKLFRAWVRALRGVAGLVLVGGVDSVPFAGTGLAGWSVEGRFPLDPAVVEDLSSFSRRKCGAPGHTTTTRRDQVDEAPADVEDVDVEVGEEAEEVLAPAHLCALIGGVLHLGWVGVLKSLVFIALLALALQRDVISENPFWLIAALLLGIAFWHSTLARGLQILAKCCVRCGRGDSQTGDLSGASQQVLHGFLNDVQSWADKNAGMSVSCCSQRYDLVVFVLLLQIALFGNFRWTGGAVFLLLSVMLLLLRRSTLTSLGRWRGLAGVLESLVFVVVATLLNAAYSPMAGLGVLVMAVLLQLMLARRELRAWRTLRGVTLGLHTSLVIVVAICMWSMQGGTGWTPPDGAESNQITEEYPFCHLRWPLGKTGTQEMSLIDFADMCGMTNLDSADFNSTLQSRFPGWTLEYEHRAGETHVYGYNDWTTFFELADPSNETTIFAIRGTQSPLDVMQDLNIFTPVAVTQIASFFGPDLTSSVTKTVFSFFSGLPTIDKDFFEVLLKHVRAKVNSSPDRRFYLTGHSLGGGLAKLVALEVGRKSVTFASPGLRYTSEMLLSKETAVASDQLLSAGDRLGTVVVPEHDLVSRVDQQLGAELGIACDKNPLSCHTLTHIIWELHQGCKSF
eukprot:s2319_g3.t1